MRPGPGLLHLHFLLALSTALLAACDRQAAKAPPEPEPRPAPAAEPTAVRLPPPVIDRAALLQALDRAASAQAAGQPDPDADLVGRRFVLRQAFGCQGPAPTPVAGVGRWVFTRDGRALDIDLTPADWSGDPIFATAAPAWEAVEGVWIVRPWMRTDGCPARATTSEPAAAPQAGGDATPPTAPGVAPQVFGLATVFAHGGSRLGRRDGKPFAFTVRADGDDPPVAPANGYRLVVEGRLAAFPQGGAIRCRASSPDARPICIAAAEVDRVAFEDADGKLLREWRPS